MSEVEPGRRGNRACYRQAGPCRSSAAVGPGQARGARRGGRVLCRLAGVSRGGNRLRRGCRPAGCRSSQCWHQRILRDRRTHSFWAGRDSGAQQPRARRGGQTSRECRRYPGCAGGRGPSAEARAPNVSHPRVGGPPRLDHRLWLPLRPRPGGPKDQHGPAVLASVDEALTVAFGTPERVPDGVALRTDRPPVHRRRPRGTGRQVALAAHLRTGRPPWLRDWTAPTNCGSPSRAGSGATTSDGPTSRSPGGPPPHSAPPGLARPWTTPGPGPEPPMRACLSSRPRPGIPASSGESAAAVPSGGTWLLDGDLVTDRSSTRTSNRTAATLVAGGHPRARGELNRRSAGPSSRRNPRTLPAPAGGSCDARPPPGAPG
jgi:hypothetical protein